MDEKETLRSRSARAIASRLQHLQDAVAAGGQYFDPYVSARAQDDLRSTQERMRLGTDITVVALVGGTGSGKSSLFNALTGLEFADSGDVRPMTERPSACIYGADAGELLDYLAIDYDRRISHTSELNIGNERFDKLILIDLPDHDSVAVNHSLEVERLLPMVDILIWVLDPQKYADQVLHASYLEKLTARSHVMLVTMNHIDTVRESQRDVLLDDLHQLLARDGLADVPVVTTSAMTGEGVEELAQVIRETSQRPSVNALTAAAELDAIGRRLQFNVGMSEVDLYGSQRDDVVDRIAQASGVGAAAESLRNAGATLFKTALVRPEKLGNSMAMAIRDSWIAFIKQGLPEVWQKAVIHEVASSERLRNGVGNAVRSLELPRIRRSTSWLLVIFGLLLAGVGFGLAIAGLPFYTVVSRVGVALGGFVLATVSYVLARYLLRRQCNRLAQQYESAALDAVGEVFDQSMVVGPAAVLEKHRITRKALEIFSA
ncbi:50S ribosome-binding GTPase [Arcanobacterium phocisimile]|uniref:50S ribosome-binding GTPase n=1 Tax=Arcanobacterium phocisimile TaxID=1302235 RepID=A0ABX7IL95_9ACTO|nr:GTP-binding protein [Arcanobacterium phocisimile]QRV02603.1 50S ribosome-binding GTPase [Arcanobacterium phocisimile]